MAYSHASFKAGYISVMEAGSGAEDADAAREAIAEAFATLMQSTIATLQVNSGIAVQVTPATGTGATTATGAVT